MRKKLILKRQVEMIHVYKGWKGNPRIIVTKVRGVKEYIVSYGNYPLFGTEELYIIQGKMVIRRLRLWLQC